MKKFFKDFKAFITKGNIVDMAIGVIIGGAFSKIVSSLVNDIIMPLISLAVGGIAVSDWKWVIREAEYDSIGTIIKNESVLPYGNFIQTIIDFLIIAFCIFLALRLIMNAKSRSAEYKINQKAAKDKKALVKKLTKEGKTDKEIELILEEKDKPVEEAVVEQKPTTEDLLAEIRDLLKTQKKENEK